MLYGQKGVYLQLGAVKFIDGQIETLSARGKYTDLPACPRLETIIFDAFKALDVNAVH